MASFDTMDDAFHPCRPRELCNCVGRLGPGLKTVNDSRAPLGTSICYVLRPKRRWLQFRLRTLLFVIAVTALFCGWPHVHRQYAFWRLHGYLGVDLKKLSDAERQNVNGWIRAVVSSNADEPFVEYRENWILYRSHKSQTAGRIYVLQMEPVTAVRVTSYCRIDILDGWGHLVRTFNFTVGYLEWPENAVFDESRYGFLCLAVETSGKWSRKRRQFYRITDDHVELLRSERLDGSMDMGSGNHFEVAEKPSDWPDWERLIASDDIVDQLRGLAAFWSYENQQNMTPIDEATQRRLESLSKSNDPWVSEESAAALRLRAEHLHRKRTR